MMSLHEKYVIELGPDGKEKKVLALDPSRVMEFDYVLYKPPPKDSADKAAVEEWLDRARFIEEDLNRLLKFPHDRFWCQLIFDSKLHKFIDSYLGDAPRRFDYVTAQPKFRDVMPSEIRQCQDKLHNLFFLICLRASTHHESSTDVIDPNIFGEIIYENYVFDIARLMDICALYGHGGQTSQLVGKMIENVFLRQPKYVDDLKAVIPDILQILEAIETKCGVQCDANSPNRSRPLIMSSLPLERMPVAEFEDIVVYLSDIAHTLYSFLATYPAGAKFFWDQGNFPVRLAVAYESLSSALSTAFHRRVWVDAEQRSYLKKQFRRSQVCLLRIFRLIAYNACLKPIVDRQTEELCVGSLIEEYLNVMNAVLSEKHFLAHLHVLYPFVADSEIMHSSTYLVDEVRLKYIQLACDDAVKKFVKRNVNRQASGDAIKLSVDQEHDRPEGDESYAVGGVEGNDFNEFEGPDVDEVPGACASVFSSEQVDSLITSVQDLLPDLGCGFIRLCLEEYDFNVERVVNAILEDKLLPSLQGVDRSLAEVPSSINVASSHEQQSTVISRRNIYDGDEFDVFSRNEVDLSRIHRGKRSTVDRMLPELTSEIKQRAAAYAYRPVDVDDVQNDDLEGLWEYDDEYDDTYDSNVVGIDDADSADELLTRRAFVTPRVLAGSRGGAKDEPECEEESDDGDVAPPRDAFVEDPAKLREIREQKFAARQQQQQQQKHRRHGAAGASANKPQERYDVKGGPRGQGQSEDVLRNRAWKEKNKASRVNHNRKDLADRKRRV